MRARRRFGRRGGRRGALVVLRARKVRVQAQRSKRQADNDHGQHQPVPYIRCHKIEPHLRASKQKAPFPDIGQDEGTRGATWFRTHLAARASMSASALPRNNGRTRPLLAQGGQGATVQRWMFSRAAAASHHPAALCKRLAAYLASSKSFASIRLWNCEQCSKPHTGCQAAPAHA